MSAYRASFFEGEWERPRPAFAQKLHSCGEASIRMIQLDYTGEPRDWCNVGHAGYIIEGQLQMEFANETLVYGQVTPSRYQQAKRTNTAPRR